MQQPFNKNPNDGEDKTRLIAAIVISLLILVGFNYFVDRPKMEEARRRAEISVVQKAAEIEVKKEDVKISLKCDVRVNR